MSIEPGIHEHLPFDEYVNIDAINASSLNAAVDGQYINIRAMDHYLRNGTESTDSMRLGTLFHSCVLEPDTIAGGFIRMTEGDGRTKAVKEARAAEQAEAESTGKLLLKPDEYDKLTGMLTAIHDPHHSQARKIISAADRKELTIVWDCPETGLRCKARLDMVLTEHGMIPDLKSSISPAAFGRSIGQYGYHRQFAWYRRGWSVLTGELCNVIAIVVQNVPPFSVMCYDFEPDDLDSGESQCLQIARKYSAWRESGEKPMGLPDALVTATVPDWAKEPLEE